MVAGERISFGGEEGIIDSIFLIIKHPLSKCRIWDVGFRYSLRNPISQTQNPLVSHCISDLGCRISVLSPKSEIRNPLVSHCILNQNRFTQVETV